MTTHDPEVVGIGDHVLALRDGAVQSETIDGREVAVIDATGRVQLPTSVLDAYPDRRAVIDVDDDGRSMRITPP